MALAAFVLKTWLRHPNEDVLEAYALHRLDGAKLARLEEHLLACEHCQARLQQVDEFVLVMRQASEPAANTAPGAGRSHATGKWLLNWFPLTSGRVALAGAAALLCGIAIVERPRSADSPPVVVALTALRGGDPGEMASAPAGRPLSLSIFAPDIGPCPGCRVQIVNASGGTAWSGNAAWNGERLTVTASVALRPGVYWVRLYTGGDAPAREFGLRLN